MLQNYIKTALRHLRRNRVYSILNLMGLAIGLTISIIIMLFVLDEMSYDRFHSHSKNIYRLGIKRKQTHSVNRSAITSPAMGKDLVSNIPEITDQVLLKPYYQATLLKDDKKYSAGEVLFAGSSFFQIFSFNLLVGDEKEVLQSPNSIVITRRLSKKIFGDQDPLGKTLLLHNKFRVTVKGLAQAPPSNSHIGFDAVVSFSTLHQIKDFYTGWDGNFSYYTYLLFEAGKTPEDAQAAVSDLFDRKVNQKMEDWRYEPIFEPLEEIYLKSDLLYDFSRSGSMRTVYVFSGIAFLILLIAMINFVNLSTALSLNRIREVGLRKVNGASKNMIIKQFLGESMLMSILALILAMIGIEMTLPGFNHFFQKQLSLYQPSNWPLLIGIPILIVFIGIIAGSYPAFYVSRVRPAISIKDQISGRMPNLSMQNALVLVQFIISAGLIISSLVIYSQLSFVGDKDLGYDKNNLIALRLDNQNSIRKSDLLREQFNRHPHIQHTSVASDYPVNGLTRNGYVPEGLDKVISIHALYVDPHYLETLRMKIMRGENFDKRTPDTSRILINQTLARDLNWENPLGKTITRNGVDYQVIGVVKDFHYESLHKPIGPVLFTLKPRKQMIMARISEGHFDEATGYIKKQWEAITGDNFLGYTQVSKAYERMYQSESRFAEKVLFFTVLAIFLACLGLFGLTAISTTRRIKEMGIRKTLGADIMSLNWLMLRQYTRWVVYSNMVAWPLAYYLMRQWLENFAYRIDLNLEFFLAGGAITLLISILTISWLASRVAHTNPAHCLRDE
ncbi:MAG: ABC transporter permease [Bacteroidales bacterium]|nr:ABC transporter permease [Bacteroidales bacterium]